MNDKLSHTPTVLPTTKRAYTASLDQKLSMQAQGHFIYTHKGKIS